MVEEYRGLSKNTKKHSLAKAYFIHVVNLYTLLEYDMPRIQDYGIAIKLNSADSFFMAFKKLFRLFLMLHSSGSNMYSLSMALFYGHWQYWMEKKAHFHSSLLTHAVLASHARCSGIQPHRAL